MTEDFCATTQPFLILRKPRSSHLEGRTAGDATLLSLAAPGGGEGRGEVGDSGALADAHLTLPALRAGPLPLRPEGRRGINGEALGGTLPSELRQALLRRHAIGDRLLGIFVAQFVEAETAALDDVRAAGERRFVAAEQPHHLRGRLQMAL